MRLSLLTEPRLSMMFLILVRTLGSVRSWPEDAVALLITDETEDVTDVVSEHMLLVSVVP